MAPFGALAVFGFSWPFTGVLGFEMGVAGAALATILSQASNAALVIITLLVDFVPIVHTILLYHFLLV